MYGEKKSIVTRWFDKLECVPRMSVSDLHRQYKLPKQFAVLRDETAFPRRRVSNKQACVSSGVNNMNRSVSVDPPW